MHFGCQQSYVLFIANNLNLPFSIIAGSVAWQKMQSYGRYCVAYFHVIGSTPQREIALMWK